MAFTRDGILDVAKLGIREVTLGRGLGTVYVRGLSLREYDGFEMVVTEAKRSGLITLRAELLVRTLCDERGARLFADGDVEALAGLDQVALEPAFQAAAELSGLREDVENSPGGPGGGSSSGSPTASAER